VLRDRRLRHLLLRAAALGGATGLRSTVGISGLAWRRSDGRSARFERMAAALALAAELVIDKLPTTPSRLDPKPLAGRALFAGVGGAVLARSQHAPAFAAMAIAAGAALTSARVGHDTRVASARRMPDTALAAIEDAVAIWLAAWATRGYRRGP
jgi:uncharacterized membrane protein